MPYKCAAISVHGDLQHDNIIITQEGSIKLIDYNMFIPEFKGQNSLEIGHANYQHPRRTWVLYNERMDDFSSVLIFMSLRAIALEPYLFSEYNNKDNLIFTCNDFLYPDNSELLSHLEKNTDKILNHCIDALERCLTNR